MTTYMVFVHMHAKDENVAKNLQFSMALSPAEENLQPLFIG